MSHFHLLVLLGALAAVSGKGVTEWCVSENKFLGDYCSGTHVYPDLETAKENCLAREDCFGVTEELGEEVSGNYTLRSDWRLQESTSGERSYVPCGGFFHCNNTFGLKSIHGTFLSTQADGTVDWDRTWYRGWEEITFEQWGKDSGFLRSTHGRYLCATPSGTLEWNRTWKRAWEFFKVTQYEDKIALRSIHGMYLSAQPDGTADADRAAALAWEWSTVHPQECLSNIECDCSKAVSRDDYDLENVAYDVESAVVYADQPETVGFQFIHNEKGIGEQIVIFKVHETRTETARFIQSAGANVMIGTEFSAAYPRIEEGKIYEELSRSYDFSHGSQLSEETTMEASYHCNAPPGRAVKCLALLFRYQSEVPYTQTWRHKRLPCTCESTGVFSEISDHEMRLLVEEK